MSTHHLVIVSGSNKGFGKSIAKSYVKQLLKNQSHFIDLILLGRNEEQLVNTKTEIQTQLGNFGRVHYVNNVELSNIKDLKTKFEEISDLIKVIFR
jgi:sepiapterin reductase